MLNYIKYLGVVILTVLLLTNCTKEKDKVDTQTLGEVVFAAIDLNTDKNDPGDPDFDISMIECDPLLEVNYAKVVLNGETYRPLTFVLDGMLYTQSLKLLPGDYVIEEFSLMDDMGTSDYGDDMVVKSTPLYGSHYADFVSYPLLNPDYPIDFTVVEFLKEEFSIDVLCYVPADIGEFGFEWFEVTQMTILEQCFFGDICIDNADLYGGSLYGPIIDVDEIAIFKIDVWRDGEFVESFENTYYVGDVLMFTSPLCIEYANYDLEDNVFDFVLSIYVDDYGSFGYMEYYTWTFSNFDMIPSNNGEDVDDGVVDFVLGDCVMDPADLNLDWMMIYPN